LNTFSVSRKARSQLPLIFFLRNYICGTYVSIDKRLATC